MQFLQRGHGKFSRSDMLCYILLQISESGISVRYLTQIWKPSCLMFHSLQLMPGYAHAMIEPFQRVHFRMIHSITYFLN